MTVPQAATSVYWNRKVALVFSGRTCGSAVAPLFTNSTLARLGQPENFVGNDPGSKTIVHLSALSGHAVSNRHAKCFSPRLPQLTNVGASFWSAEVIGRVPYRADARFIFITAVFSQIFCRNENNRRRAISDLGAIGDFTGAVRGSDFLSETCEAQSRVRSASRIAPADSTWRAHNFPCTWADRPRSPYLSM